MAMFSILCIKSALQHPDNIIQNMKKARKNPDIFDAASWTNINIVELIYSLSLLRTNK